MIWVMRTARRQAKSGHDYHNAQSIPRLMARIFLSHSSEDKEFVRRLYEDLLALGHSPWLDEWRIKVGDCIISSIQDGLKSSDYIIVVLSPAAVASGWVEREWKEAYWSEVSAGRTMVLPVLLADCEIPFLIRTKKYADFRHKYELGLATLCQAILPPQLAEAQRELESEAPASSMITSLISTIHDEAQPLSKSIADALDIATRQGDKPLLEFCRHELAGWKGPEAALGLPSYRSYVTYLSFGYVDPNFLSLSTSADVLFGYMDAHPKEFIQRRTEDRRPVAQLESQAAERPENPRAYAHWTLPYSQINPDAEDPDRRVHCYARATCFADVLQRIKSELTAHLIRLLPALQEPSTEHAP